MRFATFNLSSGRSPADGRVDLARLSAAITALDADVLALQEVDRDQPRSGGADLTGVAADALGAAHRVFAPTLYGTPGGRWRAAQDGRAGDGPAYGCALVSRFPLLDVEIVRMPGLRAALPLYVPGAGVVVVREEPRVAVVAVVDRGAGGPVTVVSTHLPFVPGWKGRQLRRLVDAVAGRPDPLLLLGDLNLRGATPARITGWSPLSSAPTFPAHRPRFQLDHVLLRDPAGALGRVTGVSTPTSAVSDHRPVVVEVAAPG